MAEQEQNDNFIQSWSGFYCDACGGHEMCSPCRLMLEFGYGSEHDGDRFIMDLCGDCADKFMEELPEGIGKLIHNDWFWSV